MGSLDQVEELDCISDWRKAEEYVYWKSLAETCLIENEMLKRHIKDLHIELMDQSNLINESLCHGDVPEDAVKPCINENTTQKQYNDFYKQRMKKKSHVENKENRTSNSCQSEDDSHKKDDTNRSEMLKKIYGTHATQIAGFETALQLNYERECSQLNAKHWPQLQLNTNFNSEL